MQFSQVCSKCRKEHPQLGGIPKLQHFPGRRELTCTLEIPFLKELPASVRITDSRTARGTKHWCKSKILCNSWRQNAVRGMLLVGIEIPEAKTRRCSAGALSVADYTQLFRQNSNQYSSLSVFSYSYLPTLQSISSSSGILNIKPNSNFIQSDGVLNCHTISCYAIPQHTIHTAYTYTHQSFRSLLTDHKYVPPHVYVWTVTCCYSKVPAEKESAHRLCNESARGKALEELAACHSTAEHTNEPSAHHSKLGRIQLLAAETLPAACSSITQTVVGYCQILPQPFQRTCCVSLRPAQSGFEICLPRGPCL